MLKYNSKLNTQEEMNRLIPLIPIKSSYQVNLYGLTRAVSPNYEPKNPHLYQNLSVHCLDGFDAKIFSGSFIVAVLGGGRSGDYKNPLENRALVEMAYNAPREINGYILKKFFEDKNVFTSALLGQEAAARWSKSIQEKLISGFEIVGKVLLESTEYLIYKPNTTLLSMVAFPYTDRVAKYYHIEGFNFGNSLALLYSPPAQEFNTISPGVIKKARGIAAPAQYPCQYLDKKDNYRPFTLKAKPGDFIILCSDNVADYLPHTVKEVHSYEQIAEHLFLNDPEINQYLTSILNDKPITAKGLATTLANYALKKDNSQQNFESLNADDFTLLVIQLPIV